MPAPELQHGFASINVIRTGIYPYPVRSLIFFAFVVSILIAGRMLSRRDRPYFFQGITEILTRNLALTLGIVAALGFLLRIVAFLRGGLGWSAAGDAVGYIRLADGLRTGCGFATRVAGACGPPDIVRTPGYPAFLAIMPNLATAVVVQSIIAVAACFAMGIAIAAVFGAPAGVLTAALVCFDPFSIIAGAKTLTDALFQGLLVFAVLLELYVVAKDRADWRTLGIALLSGALLAVAVLARPIGQVVVFLVPLPFLGMTDLQWRRRILLAACMVLIPAVAITGWAERNQQCCGYRNLSAIQVGSLYYYRAAGVLAFESGRGLTAIRQQLENEGGVPLTRLLDDEPDQPSPMTKQFAENLRQRAMTIIRRDPQAAIAVTAIRFAFISFWVVANDVSEVFDSPPQTINGRWRRLTEGCFVVGQLAVSAFVWIGFAYAIKRSFAGPIKQTTFILFPALVGLILLAAASGPEANGRYRVAAVPYLAAVGSIGWLGRSREQCKGRN